VRNGAKRSASLQKFFLCRLPKLKVHISTHPTFAAQGVFYEDVLQLQYRRIFSRIIFDAGTRHLNAMRRSFSARDSET